VRGADAEAQAQRRDATSRRRVRPTNFGFADPRFEHSLLQNFE
jgi:hypothetical protein